MKIYTPSYRYVYIYQYDIHVIPEIIRFAFLILFKAVYKCIFLIDINGYPSYNFILHYFDQLLPLILIQVFACFHSICFKQFDACCISTISLSHDIKAENISYQNIYQIKCIPQKSKLCQFHYKQLNQDELDLSF